MGVIQQERRCSVCGVSWPVTAVKIPRPNGTDGTETITFSTCPLCGEETWPRSLKSGDEPPLTPEEVQRVIGWDRFERMYEIYDRERVGPSPDEVGRREGREIAARDAPWWDAIRAYRDPPATPPGRSEDLAYPEEDAA